MRVIDNASHSLYGEGRGNRKSGGSNMKDTEQTREQLFEEMEQMSQRIMDLETRLDVSVQTQN